MLRYAMFPLVTLCYVTSGVRLFVHFVLCASLNDSAICAAAAMWACVMGGHPFYHLCSHVTSDPLDLGSFDWRLGLAWGLGGLG